MIHTSMAYLFFWSKYVAGMRSLLGCSSIEHTTHDVIHTWNEAHSQVYSKDMGAFYMETRDPIFFTHQAKADQM